MKPTGSAVSATGIAAANGALSARNASQPSSANDVVSCATPNHQPLGFSPLSSPSVASAFNGLFRAHRPSTLDLAKIDLGDASFSPMNQQYQSTLTTAAAAAGTTARMPSTPLPVNATSPSRSSAAASPFSPTRKAKVHCPYGGVASILAGEGRATAPGIHIPTTPTLLRGRSSPLGPGPSPYVGQHTMASVSGHVTGGGAVLPPMTAFAELSQLCSSPPLSSNRTLSSFVGPNGDMSTSFSSALSNSQNLPTGCGLTPTFMNPRGYPMLVSAANTAMGRSAGMGGGSGNRREKNVCRHFLEGKCNRGSACRFFHPGSKHKVITSPYPRASMNKPITPFADLERQRERDAADAAASAAVAGAAVDTANPSPTDTPSSQTSDPDSHEGSHVSSLDGGHQAALHTHTHTPQQPLQQQPLGGTKYAMAPTAAANGPSQPHTRMHGLPGGTASSLLQSPMVGPASSGSGHGNPHSPQPVARAGVVAGTHPLGWTPQGQGAHGAVPPILTSPSMGTVNGASSMSGGSNGSGGTAGHACGGLTLGSVAGNAVPSSSRRSGAGSAAPLSEAPGGSHLAAMDIPRHLVNGGAPEEATVLSVPALELPHPELVNGADSIFTSPRNGHGNGSAGKNIHNRHGVHLKPPVSAGSRDSRPATDPADDSSGQVSPVSASDSIPVPSLFSSGTLYQDKSVSSNTNAFSGSPTTNRMFPSSSPPSPKMRGNGNCFIPSTLANYLHSMSNSSNSVNDPVLAAAMTPPPHTPYLQGTYGIACISANGDSSSSSTNTATSKDTVSLTHAPGHRNDPYGWWPR